MGREQAPSPAGDIALLSCAIIWGTTFLLTKQAMAHSSPAAFNATRFVLAAIFLLPLALRAGRQLLKQALGWGAALGFLTALAFWLQTWGLTRIGPSRSAFVTTFYVFFTFLIEWAVSRRAPRAPVIVGAIVAFSGVTVMTGAGWGAPINLGDVATLACAFVFAAQMVTLSEALKRHSSRAILFLEITVCGLLLLPAAFALDRPPRLALDAHGVGAAVYLALVATAVVLGLQNFGQARTTPSRAGVLFASEPVWAAIFSAIFYGERLSRREMAGAGLVLAGLLTVTLVQRRPASTSRASSPS